jgi:hypothetical protein
MSVSARTVVRSERAPSTIFLGLDVHKASVTIAVLPSDAAAPTHVDKRRNRGDREGKELTAGELEHNTARRPIKANGARPIIHTVHLD